jgi:arylsulfatase A-like enzyme
MRAYREENLKLIEYFVNGELHSQFFNLEQDPYEIKNLLDQEKHAAKYQEMKLKMTQEMKMQNDTSEMYGQLVEETAK